jgi:hypothetical protein
VGVRACFTGFDPSEDQQWRDIELLPRIKANQNVYWYGNNLAAYNLEAAGHFRYPWRPEQLGPAQSRSDYDLPPSLWPGRDLGPGNPAPGRRGRGL